MATGRQVTYTLQLNSNVSAILNQADKDSNKFNSSMWELQKTLASFGVGLGAHFLIDGAKEWTQAAADYETAMLRIKNASSSFGQGLNNQSFINKEIDDFKLKLDEGVEAYGKFLFKIKNANLTSGAENRMYDNILTISKVGGLSQSDIDATTRNISTMLGEGILEARHLRALSYVHPQIIPFIADQMGLKSGQADNFSKILKGKDDDETASQKLSLLISGGKLTKMALPANIIVEALEKYRLSIQDKLPETLNTLQSEINDLSNTWERFKINLTLDNKEELVGFFHSLLEGVHFLVEHEDGIVRGATAIANLVKMYAEWRLALFALQAPAGIIGFFANEQERLVNVFSVYGSKAGEVAAANERVFETDNLIISSQKSIIDESIIEAETFTKKTIALDLYTEAQLTNIAATEKLKDEWFQLDMFGTGATSGDISMLGFGTKNGNTSHGLNNKYRYPTEDAALALNAENLAMRTNLGLVEASTTQAILFSEAEMNATISIGKYNTELGLQNALVEERRALSTTDLALANANLLTFGMNGNAGAGIGTMLGATGKFASSLIQTVFIAGISAEVAKDLGLFGSRQGGDIGITDLMGLTGWAHTPEGIMKTAQAELNMPKFLLSQEDIQSVEDLHKAIKLFGSLESIPFTKDGQIDYAAYAAIQPARLPNGFNWYNNIAAMQYGIPAIPEPGKNDGSYSNKNSSALGKDTHHLKGNSSNYFTVNIHEMNGVKQYTVKTDSTGFEMTEKNVEQMIGDGIIKALTDAVNDSQLLSNNHH